MISYPHNTLIGYKEIFNELIKIYSSNSLPNKILFSGRKGIGKSTFAYHLINYLFSTDEDFKYDLFENKINLLNKSHKLLISGSHPNFFKISLNSEKKYIDISQVREMINFANKSSFNNKEKIILIDDCEYLNKNSSHALLKIIEEPQNNLLFLLIYDNQKKIESTLKSRCVEFKFNINENTTKEIVNSVMNEDIFDKISADFINYSNTPLNYINFINICNSFNLDYQNITIEDFVSFIFNNKSNLKKILSNDDIKFYLELYFLKSKLLSKNENLFNLFSYFNKKYKFINKFNLDFDTYLIEFKSKMINE